MTKDSVAPSLAGRIRAGLRVLRRSPRQFLHECSNRAIVFEQWYVYSWTPSELATTEIDPTITVRALTTDDLRRCCERTDRLGDQARLFFADRGIASAFAFLKDDVIAHTSWIYTASEYAKEPFATLKLRAREAEIKHCYTVNHYRGQGLYRYAIRYLSRARFELGDTRVFMTVDAENHTSIRGIESAGLKRCGDVWRASSALLPFIRRLAVRRVKRD